MVNCSEVNDDCIQSELRQHADRVQQNRCAAGRAGGDITQDHGQEAPRGAALTPHRRSPHARLRVFCFLYSLGDMATCSARQPAHKHKHTKQTEIEALRRARAEGLDDIANSMRVELEIAGFVSHRCSVHDAVLHLRSCVYVVARAREGRDAETRERQRKRASERARESERERERASERESARESEREREREIEGERELY
jgi:hypothetical protein